jgi:hydrocephalus-inducing protein
MFVLIYLCAAKVALEVQDAGKALPAAAPVPVAIKGEAYKMEVDVRFPQVRE